MKKAKCLECKYYFITFDPKAPYGCKGYGFKSKAIPSKVVLQSSSMECKLFEQKNKTSDDNNNTKSNLYA